LEAEKALALRLLEELGVAASPQLKAELDRPATLNFGALVAYGRGVRSMYGRDLSGAATHFQNAVSLDPNFAAARQKLGQVQQEMTGTVRVARGGRRAAGDLAVEQVSSMAPPSLIDRPGGPVDPAYPTTRAFIVVIVRGQ
jgi:hypothetical protein